MTVMLTKPEGQGLLSISFKDQEIYTWSHKLSPPANFSSYFLYTFTLADKVKSTTSLLLFHLCPNNKSLLLAISRTTVISTITLCASHYPGHVLFKRCQIYRQVFTLRGCGRKKTKPKSRGVFISRVKRYGIVGDYGSPRDVHFLTPLPLRRWERYFASITPRLRAISTLSRYPYADIKHNLHSCVNSLLSSLSSALYVKGKLINKPPVYPLTLLACK